MTLPWAGLRVVGADLTMGRNKWPLRNVAIYSKFYVQHIKGLQTAPICTTKQFSVSRSSPGRDSSVGRAADLRARGPGFNTHSQLNLARDDSAFHPFVGRKNEYPVNIG